MYASLHTSVHRARLKNKTQFLHFCRLLWYPGSQILSLFKEERCQGAFVEWCSCFAKQIWWMIWAWNLMEVIQREATGQFHSAPLMVNIFERNSLLYHVYYTILDCTASPLFSTPLKIDEPCTPSDFPGKTIDKASDFGHSVFSREEKLKAEAMRSF